MTDPSAISEILAPYKKIKYAVIDEIQKIPPLLDEIQELIENDGFKFLLTGSSPRKLKRSHANMLGGRAASISLFPLTYSEIPDFNIDRYLRWGGLPRIYLSEDPMSELESYLKSIWKKKFVSKQIYEI